MAYSALPRIEGSAHGVNYGFAFELGGNTTFTAVTNYQATTGAGGTTPNTAFRSGNPYGSGTAALP